MKQTVLILTMAVLGIFHFASCHKKSSSPTSICQITEAKYLNGSDSVIYDFTYNNEGKLSGEQIVAVGVNYNIVFTYAGNTELIYTTDGSQTETDSLTLNGDGLVTYDYHISGTDTTVTTYTYSKTELQMSVAVTNEYPPDTTIYSWTNGDLTTIDYVGDQTATYSYNTLASEPGDAWQFEMMTTGYTFVRTAHQVTGEGPRNPVIFGYTYDNTGKITSCTTGQQSSVAVQTYQYSCN
jgi:hypothetical protein